MFVLLFLLLCIFISLFMQDLASAEYFNGSWFEQRQKVQRENYFSDSVELSAEEEAEYTTFGFKLPEKITRPVVTTTDSIDVEKLRIRRQKEIPGLRVENYYFIHLDDYLQENIEKTNNILWEKEKKKQMKNWTVDRSGGVTDLDFVIPVGKRFEGFVGGKTNIRIDGQQRIEFAGKSEFDVGVIETATTKNSTFPSLTMKQEPKFSIRGNVGDRITVDIQQDPQAGFSSVSFSLFPRECCSFFQYFPADNHRDE